jgi:hypothetical protein
MPLTDYERYQKLSSSVQMGTGPEYTAAGYPNQPNSWIFLFSAGPFGSIPTEPDSSVWELPPGDSCNIVMAVVTVLFVIIAATYSSKRIKINLIRLFGCIFVLGYLGYILSLSNLI